MKKFLALLLPLLVAAVASAQFQFEATLTPAQDGGGARTGSGVFALTLTGTTLAVNGTYSGLSANSTASHIHGPSSVFPASAGVLYDFGALGLTTFGSTAGTISGNISLVVKQAGAYSVDQQITDLKNGLWYVNVHSTAFPGGEIRGQILAVPEPSTWALAGLGAVGLLAWQRCRRVRCA